MDLRTRLIAPSFLTLNGNKKIFDIDNTFANYEVETGAKTE